MPIILIPIVILIVILILGYTKAPPNKAAVITGLGKRPRVLLGKAGFNQITFLIKTVVLLKIFHINYVTGFRREDVL